MKIHLLLALGGLALALLSQWLPNRRLIQKQSSSLMSSIRSSTRHSTTRMQPPWPHFFTEDAVQVTPEGPIYGRDAIQKWYEGALQQFFSVTILARPTRIPFAL
jgi:hypothetical protein